MTVLKRRLSTASDIAILVVAALVCAVLIRDFIAPRRVPAAGAKPPLAELPSPLRLNGIDFSRSERTLVFALSTQCGYCRASEPFYRQLTSATFPDVQFAAAMMQPLTESRAYLQQAGLHFPQVVTADLEAMGVAGTPTLILTDRKGNVLRQWRGKLSAEDEKRVVEAAVSGLL